MAKLFSLRPLYFQVWRLRHANTCLPDPYFQLLLGGKWYSVQVLYDISRPSKALFRCWALHQTSQIFQSVCSIMLRHHIKRGDPFNSSYVVVCSRLISARLLVLWSLLRYLSFFFIFASVSLTTALVHSSSFLFSSS